MSENKISIFIDVPNISSLLVKVIGVGSGAVHILNCFQPKINNRWEIIAIDADENCPDNSRFAKTVFINDLTNNSDEFEKEICDVCDIRIIMAK